MTNVNSNYTQIYNNINNLLQNWFKEGQEIDFAIIYECIVEELNNLSLNHIQEDVYINYTIDNNYELDYNKAQITINYIYINFKDIDIEDIKNLLLHPALYK